MDVKKILLVVYTISTSGSIVAMSYCVPYIVARIQKICNLMQHSTVSQLYTLTNHQIIYREVSLLLKRLPGRETFSGDIFYIHSSLLENGGVFSYERNGEGNSIIPCLETAGGEIRQYIPTNIISITDGQFFFDRYFRISAILPAINPITSVSRVGSVVQPEYIAKIAGIVRFKLSSFNEINKFRFMQESLPETSISVLQFGDKILAVQVDIGIIENLNSKVNFQRLENLNFDELFLLEILIDSNNTADEKLIHNLDNNSNAGDRFLGGDSFWWVLLICQVSW